METCVVQSKLQLLERRLWRDLRAKLDQIDPLQIQCALKQNTLLVLLQHAAEVSLPIEPTMAVVTRTISHLQSDRLMRSLTPSDTLSVRLYWRITGEKQPYLAREWTLKPTVPVPTLPVIQIAQGVSEPQSSMSVAAQPLTQLPSVTELPVESQTTAVTSMAKPAEAQSSQVAQITRPINHSWLSHIPLPVIALSLAIGCLFLTGGVYILTRPCIVGRCSPLETAQRLNQQSSRLVQPAARAENVVEAYHDLVDANYYLSQIPSWSPYHPIAQRLLQENETRTQVFEQVVEALKQAQVVGQKSQNPPHPLGAWREAQQGWRQIIASLQKVPVNSPIYPFAQRKLVEYQANLDGINRWIFKEQRAQDRVASARSTAAIATTRETEAQSVDGWKAVLATWESVVDTLRDVPPGTMAFAEAEQLLEIYQPKLGATHDRYLQEKVSADAYKHALVLGEQARRSEQQRQWSQAIVQWRTALTAANQVSTGTSYHHQTQPLISTYQVSLATAQENLRMALAIQDAESELGQLCTGATPICTYVLAKDAIQIHLTAAYDQVVQAVIINAPLGGDPRTQAALTDYVNNLLRAFTNVSQKAQLPLDLYNADNKIFSTYDPRLGGFVQR
jgi:hypothetical protein